MIGNISAYAQFVLKMIDGVEQVTPPSDFQSQVQQAKLLLSNDTTGLIAPIYSLMVNAVKKVRFSYETGIPSLNAKLNSWLESVNRQDAITYGNIQSGFQAVVEQIAMQYWLSSFVMLAQDWGTIGKYKFPNSMLVLDAEKLKVVDEQVDCRRYKYTYASDHVPGQTRLSYKRCAWTDIYPTPYLIERVFANANLKSRLKVKNSELLKQAILYLFTVNAGKKGVAWKAADFKSMAKDLASEIKKARENGTTPSHANIDFEVNQLIADYQKIFARANFEQLDMDILAGMGLISVVESAGSNRREAVLNPKPIIEEIYGCVAVIKGFLRDMVYQMFEQNKDSTNKILIPGRTIHVVHTPINTFWSDEYKTLIRGLFDRGVLTRQDLAEAVDQEIEVLKIRHERELRDGFDVTFYPPHITNQEQYESSNELLRTENTTEDKTNPIEKEQYFMASTRQAFRYRGAPYETVKSLPPRVKDVVADIELLRAYMSEFNKTYYALEDYPEEVRESRASAAGWKAVKALGKKGQDSKWHLKKRISKKLQAKRSK